MVNTQRMKQEAMQRLLRGAYTGVGAVVSGGIGNFLADQIDSDLGVAAGQVAVGAVLSVGQSGFEGPGEPLNRDGFIGEAVEFAGYGVQAAGWDEIAEGLNLNLGGQSSQHAGEARVVDVSAQADQSGNQQPQEQTDEFLADVG